jgi:[ribosomal protein S18]-alanine N-acetyltransferase
LRASIGRDRQAALELRRPFGADSGLPIAEREPMITECPIRLAGAADARDIARLSREAIEYGLAWSWTPRRVMASLGDAATNVIVARQEGGLLGFAVMSYGDDHAHLLLLAVQAARRRSGIGSALLQWLEATAAVAGIRSLHLETRRRSSVARAFYRRHGFAETVQLAGYYQGVEDAVRMVKHLPGPPL